MRLAESRPAYCTNARNAYEPADLPSPAVQGNHVAEHNSMRGQMISHMPDVFAMKDAAEKVTKLWDHHAALA